jgi:transporter family protein
VLSKPLSAALSPWQIQTFSTIGLIPVLGLLALSPRLKAGARPWRGGSLAFLAGVLGSAGNIACYQALAQGGKAAAVIPLTSLYPLVTIGLAVGLLGERLNGVQALGIGASLLALACFNPFTGAALLSTWVGVALVPIVLWGVSAWLQKVATTYASNQLATFGFLVGFLPVAAITPFWQALTWRLSQGTWLEVVALGLCFGLGNLTLIVAYGTGGRASIVTPLASLYSLVTIPLAMLWLGERLSAREGAGILLALAAVVALGWERPRRPAPA